MLHPLQTPVHALMLLGLGLLLGQQGMRHVGWGGLAFFLALLLGLGFSRLGWHTDGTLLFLVILVGVGLILRPRMSYGLTGLLACIAGGIIGLASTPQVLPGLKAVKLYTMMAGTLLSASLVLLLAVLLGLALRGVGEGVPLRVLGAWIVASAWMTLTLLLLKP